jgi:hypothetical protein
MHNIGDAQVGDQSKSFIDENGFGGELAFCKQFNLYPDLSIVPGGGDDLPDCTLRDGRRVDVKTTHRAGGNLLARKIQPDIDVFVLVIGKLPTYTIVGWATREQVEAAPKRNMGHGPTHFLSARALRPISDLE